MPELLRVCTASTLARDFAVSLALLGLQETDLQSIVDKGMAR